MKASSCACVALVSSFFVWHAPALADDTIKVGVVAASSGPFAQYGKQIAAGLKTYMKIHGDTVAGKKVEVIYRDSTGAPEVAKRVAQELVVRDKVDFLAGFVLTPEALAVADVATQSKKPMIVMNAAASVITTHHYSEDHASPENKAFLKAFGEAAPDDERPDFMAVAAYDGMGAIYDVAKKLGGKIDGDKAVAALAGMKIASPRGAIHIDPETRDVVQTVYVRRVQKKKDGHYYNVEFDKFADVKDPVKAAGAKK